MLNLLRKFLFPFLLFVLVSVLFFSNFKTGTYLTGWDNLQVELDLPLNISRSFNAVWQEYQGLGLLGGMAHSADLLRQLFLWPVSLVLNQNLIRYFWNFISLLLGTLGLYSLLNFFFASYKKDFSFHSLAAFFGACFYLLNIGTVQNFYPNYDPFSTFFAFLPWLLFSVFRYLSEPSKKALFLLAILSLLASTFAYVQTIFLVYLMILAIIFLWFLLTSHEKFKVKVMRVLSIFLVTLLTNAFWLLPVIYFTLMNSGTTISAKGNEMSTDVTFIRNNQYGNLQDLAHLKGFWFNYNDFDQWGNMIYVMDFWKIHFNQPLVIFFAWFFFALLLIGILSLFFSKFLSSELKKFRWLLLILFLLCCFILLGNNPPFGFIYNFLQNSLPLFKQVFRASFTKWIIPMSLFYSLFVGFGLNSIFVFLKNKFSNVIFSFIFAISLIIYSLPSFQGHFFYERLRVQIPEAYFNLFAYFKAAPQNTRIANLPQHTFYGWQWNDWGYRGSGFLWYGIKQPILDRAFDVWSEADERYYWQLQTALDKKDVKMIEQVLEEYDVDYLLLDESIVNRNTVKPFNYSALKSLLASSKRLKLAENFDFISLYTFSDQENTREKDFVSLYETLPIIDGNYKHSWADQAYLDFHDYLNNSNNNAQDAKIIYPFSSLFTNHLQKDLEFKLDEDESSFYLSSLKTVPSKDFDLQMKSPLQTETYLPFHLSWTTDKNKINLTFKALLPEIYLVDQKYYFDFAKEFVLDTKLCQKSGNCFITVNNQAVNKFSQTGQTDLLLSTKLLNSIALSGENKTDYFDYAFFDLSSYEINPKTVKTDEINGLTVKIPKFFIQSDLLKTDLNNTEAQNCRPLDQGDVLKEKRADGNYYQATGTSVCDHFYLEQLYHQASYLFRLEANNLKSIPFVFAIQADSLGRSPLETYLSEGVNYQILPPIEDFNQGYTLYLSTDSYGHEINDNFLKSAEVFAWPYNFLSDLYVQDRSWNSDKASLSTCDFQVQKKNLWFYKVDMVDGCRANYLKLSQAYDGGWLAVRDGELLQHHKFNNWANAWVLNNKESNSPIYIFFWPQLLEYLGLTLLFACFLRLKMR